MGSDGQDYNENCNWTDYDRKKGEREPPIVDYAELPHP